MTPEARYAAIQAQITQLLDDAANDTSPYAIANVGRAWLAAELYAHNEQARMAHEARTGIIQALYWRIASMEVA